MVRLIETWTELLGWIGALVLLPLTGAMIYEVGSRYLFNAPTFWAYELSYMMMGTIFLFGIAYALRHHAHVRVDLFYDGFSSRKKAVVGLFGYSLLLPCVLWLTWALYDYAVRAYTGHELSGQSAWNPPIWPYRVVYVIGMASFALQILAEVLKDLSTLIHGHRSNEAI